MTRQPPEPGADVYRIDPHHQDTAADPHPSRGYLEPPVPNFRSDRHAYACGAVLATLRELGIDAVPVIDLEGHYTPAIELVLADGAVTIHVEPPPQEP